MDLDPTPAPSLQALLQNLKDAIARRDWILAAATHERVEQRLLESWTELQALEREARELRETLEAQVLASVEPPAVSARKFSLEGELGSPAPKGLAYPVWFATTRAASAVGPGFTGARGTTTTYGTVEVIIPAATRFGESGASWLQRLIRLDLRDDTIRVTATDTSPDRAAFFAGLRQKLQAQEGPARELLIFIHGFRTTFDQAAIRTAQIGRDLGLAADTVGFFSWPSQGTVQAYASDEAAIESSERALADFLVDATRESGASKVHVVAHSMGNRGFLRALQRISAGAQGDIRFGQIFLAAPDLDRDLFLDLAPLYQRHGERTTLYTSSRDLAVYASSRLHDAPRVGLFEPVTRAAGIDTVCVPNFSVDLLGHSYYAQADALLHDMGTLLRTNQSPPRQQIDQVDDPQQVYWTFRR